MHRCLLIPEIDGGLILTRFTGEIGYYPVPGNNTKYMNK